MSHGWCGGSWNPDVVALGEFAQRSRARGRWRGLFLLRRVESGRPPHVLPLGLGAACAFGRPGADQVALDIGEVSEHAGIKRPVLVTLAPVLGCVRLPPRNEPAVAGLERA